MPIPLMPLSVVPRTIFPNLWEDYCRLFASERAAIENLGSEAGRWLAMMSEISFSRGEGDPGVDAELAARGKLDQELVGAIRLRLIERQLIATALQPPSLDRVEIPASLWGNLEMGFAENFASNADFKFTHIEVRLASDITEGRVTACEAWLKNRPRSKRKTLLDEAVVAIPGLKHREFTSAYAAVFGNKRGRPKSS